MTTIPFGRYKDRPLPDIPASYLHWLLRETKLSSGLRAAVEGELRSRGVTPPAAPPPAPPAPCRRCGDTRHVHRWALDRLGRRVIRKACAGCERFCGFAPQVEPFVREADAAEHRESAAAARLLDGEMDRLIARDG
jgi:hypothetical protein